MYLLDLISIQLDLEQKVSLYLGVWAHFKGKVHPKCK